MGRVHGIGDAERRGTTSGADQHGRKEEKIPRQEQSSSRKTPKKNLSAVRGSATLQIC